MFYNQMGKGPAVLLLHGLFGGGGYWRDVAAALAKTHRVIVPDLPGFAVSVDIPAPADIPGFALAVRQLLDELDVARCDIVGYSMGGLIAQQFTLDWPERISRLVNYATKPAAADKGRFEPFSQTVERLQSRPFEEAAESNIRAWFHRPPVPSVLDLCQQAAAGTRADTLIAALGAVDGWDIRARLDEISIPVLVISGDSDRSVPLETLILQHTSLRNSSLCVIPNCGHIAHLECPKLFTEILKGFLVPASLDDGALRS